MSSPTNPYAPRVGCPMCSIVTATPNPTPLSSPHASTFPNGSSPTTSPAHQIIWKDENVTAYVEKNNPVSSKGHIIILLNFHVPSIYALSSTDLPLLVHIQRLATRLLTQLHPSSVASSFTPNENANPPPSPGPNAAPNLPLTPTSPFRVGFITPPFRDSKIPVTDHLHVHAYIGTTDLAGWWRAMAYSSVGWYSIEDLIAEIRYVTLVVDHLACLPYVLFWFCQVNKLQTTGSVQQILSARTHGLLTESQTRERAPVCPTAGN
ncbi:scavenger mRNA decapping enzyme c-term binding domain-containing protein [Rhizoctonia solani AG-1 IA]|uniref:Scavenger mRNA decapping enzyme c-term binding domain-containing protein n=1 Tax=Thanatephorus cucumeris (strain AG1-IA) TaxID=983506 RepID=L8X347_THACA|nr:scavenger mRNA decapping enzyme c-term binding domain-containing protein [Rhizoctonia solani AG-1 IA]